MNLPRVPGWDDTDDLLVGVERIAEHCLTASAPLGWREVARLYSSISPGQWHYGDRGLAWLQGRRALWVKEPATLPAVEEARGVCLGLGVDCGWSVGNCARRLLSWVGPPQRLHADLGYIHDGAGTGFRCCQPGRWDDGIVWDASAYYYRILCRLPSLRCSPGTDGKVTWHHMDKSECSRRRDLEACVPDAKLLRNSLWGCALGSSVPGEYFCRGQPCVFPARWGPFRPAALLVARAAWELCRLASVEVGSVYSHTDCVTCVDGSVPTVWQVNGYPIVEKASGRVHIHHLQSVCVGGRVMEFYREDNQWVEPIPIAPPPRLHFGRGWAHDEAA